MTRKAVSYITVMLALEHPNNPSFFETTGRVSGQDVIDIAKKAFGYVTKALLAKDPNCLRTNNKTKGKIYWYIGEDDDPLREERQYVVKKTLQDYVDFCKATAGMLPSGWMASFFENTPMLLDLQRDAKSGLLPIQANQRDILKNIEYLPLFFSAITEHHVCKLLVKPFDKEARIIIFHPQFLKEYNGRWFVFGRSEIEGSNPYEAYNVPLDRIVEVISENIEEVKYISASPGFYDNFFNNIIGVSHVEGEQTIDIVIKTLSAYHHGRITTKKLLSNQKEVEEYQKHDDGQEYGLVSLHIEPNKELMSQIMAYGNGIEVVSPPEYRKQVMDAIQDLSKVYL